MTLAARKGEEIATNQSKGYSLHRRVAWGIGAAVVVSLLFAGLYSLRGDRPPDFTPNHTHPAAEPPPGDRSARAVYVPVYSHVYHGGGRTHLLEVTLSIRSLEVHRTLRVESVDYYDTSGRFIRSFISAPIEIDPLGTAEYLIPQDDITGGSGANFVVTWTPTDVEARAPLVQAVMVGRDGDRSFSFVCTGVPIDTPTSPLAPQAGAPARRRGS